MQHTPAPAEFLRQQQEGGTVSTRRRWVGGKITSIAFVVTILSICGNFSLVYQWWKRATSHQLTRKNETTIVGTVGAPLRPGHGSAPTARNWPSREQNELSLNPQAPPAKANSYHGLKKLLLSVPFYVYENLAWENATWGGASVDKVLSQTSNFNPKHADDYFFMKNSLRHPMRTWNASEAKLFVIPSLNNFYDLRDYYKDHDLCFNGLCNNDLMATIKETLELSPYFHSYPEAHIVVLSSYAHHYRVWPGLKDLKEMLRNASNIHFEYERTNREERWSFPKQYVSRGCALEPNKTTDVVMIATLKPDKKTFQDREIICSWLGKHQKNGTTGNGLFTSACGRASMCPVLAKAKVGFHARGDTWGSNRLIDTLMSGTVPIFTYWEQYDISTAIIDWRRISYSMDMISTLDETTFVEQLSAILNDTETYQLKLNLIRSNRHLFDWEGLYPFDLYMYMLQANLYPETRHDPGTFFDPSVANKTILKLPPLVAREENSETEFSVDLRSSPQDGLDQLRCVEPKRKLPS